MVGFSYAGLRPVEDVTRARDATYHRNSNDDPKSSRVKRVIIWMMNLWVAVSIFACDSTPAHKDNSVPYWYFSVGLDRDEAARHVLRSLCGVQRFVSYLGRVSSVNSLPTWADLRPATNRCPINQGP